MVKRPASGRVKGGYSLFIVAIVASLLMIVSLIIQPAPAAEGDGWAVKAGDVLQYSIAGQRNGTAVSGTATSNFTVVNVTGKISTVGGYFYTDLGSWAGRGVTSALSSPTSDECLGWERIETVYGAKAVTRYISYHSGNGTEAQTFVITYAGVDSKVIYRVNVSGPGFFLSLDLSTSTLDDPYRLDTGRDVDISHSFMTPNVMNFTSIDASGTLSVGYWYLPEGAHLSHSMESEGSLFYLVTRRRTSNAWSAGAS